MIGIVNMAARLNNKIEKNPVTPKQKFCSILFSLRISRFKPILLYLERLEIVKGSYFSFSQAQLKNVSSFAKIWVVWSGGIQRPKNVYLGKSKPKSQEPIPIQNPEGRSPEGFWIGIGSRDEVWIFQGKHSLVVGYTFLLSRRRTLLMKTIMKT